jgi:AraC family transcriptional regulator, transcriptional activator of pobA
MPVKNPHIPFLENITDFFRVYGLGKPLYEEVMCMKLEEQPDNKLMNMPLSRANFFRVLHFTNANLHFTSGEKKIAVFNNCLCFTYPGKLESWTRTGRLYGYVIYFTPAFAELDSTSKHFDIDYPYFNFDSEAMLPLSDSEAADLKFCADEMIKEIYSDAPDKLEMIKKLLQVYLQKIRRSYNKRVNSFSADTRVTKNLFNRFRKELDEYMQQLAVQKKHLMPTVSIMAKAIHIHPNYLNSVIKTFTGKTASAHINSKIILEAKSFLLHTDLQVMEIADRIGFESTSYFNRFFKKHTGTTPLELRKGFAKK